MKKWIALLLALALAAGITGFSAAEEEDGNAVELSATGAVLRKTEKMRNARGLFVKSEASGIQGMDDARLATVDYLAMSREEYAPYEETILRYLIAAQDGTEVSDEVLSAAMKASQELQEKETPLLWILALPDSQPYENTEQTILSMLAGGDQEALEVRELGSAGSFTYRLLSPRPGAAAFAQYSSVLGDFADEYDALLADMDSVAANIRPTGPDIVAIGTRIEFELKDLDGNPVSSRELFARHEVTMLNVYTTWCGYCYQEMPELERLSQEYAGRDVAIVGLCVDAEDEQRIAAAKQMVADTGVTYLNLAGTQDLSNQLKVTAYPTSFFINRAGETVLYPMAGAYISMYPVKIEAALGANRQEQEASPAGSAGLKGVYRVKVTDGDGDPVPGAYIGFCTDAACVPVETDAAGTAVFEGARGEYHIQIVELPDGYAEPDLGDLYLGPEDGEMTISVEKE